MKKQIKTVLYLGLSLLIMVNCIKEARSDSFNTDNSAIATKLYGLMQEELINNEEAGIRYTLNSDGSLRFATLSRDWTIGFYPGSLWYLHDLTQDEKWRTRAERYTEIVTIMQYNKLHHDVGFIIGSSYLNGVRKGNKSNYKSIVIQAAKSLSSRF